MQSVFLEKEFVFKEALRGKTETLEIGNYEFPFEVLLPGDAPESVEGLYDCWVLYRMKATIARGRLAHKLHAQKKLRVIRTLNPSSLELSHAASVENIWPDKLEYSIVVPCRAAIFGTCVKMEFTLIPILKGLRIGRIIVQLRESQDFVLYDETYTINREVAVAEYNISEGFETLGEDQDGFRLRQTLALPRTLKRCVQDIDCKGIKVQHKLNFTVQLHNPDGHLSELRATLPVYIFISPHLLLGEDSRIVGSNLNDPRTLDALNQHAPPLYGEHESDVPWDHLDPNGYMTPVDGASSVSTPFHNRSRSQSLEDSDPMNWTATGTLRQGGLRDHLHNLPDPNSSFWPSNTHPNTASPSYPGENDSFPGTSTTLTQDPYQPSNPSDGSSVRRRSSSASYTNSLSWTSSTGPPSPRTPEHFEMDVNELSKVPSYTTALRNTSRTPLRDDLPTYFFATSSPSPSTEMPQTSNQASGDLQRRHLTATSMSPPTLLGRAEPRSTLSTRFVASDDRERRPGLLQARSTTH
ncbi:hypothetical protein FGG08_000656 [Glutinoglossum americanum]|uniref:Arrestin C-terminal-like domain-containing protein n=1 Tax=Glutinoglossum americanum TaxID=1670608 RepID=A0A9P8L6P8_9PEZI|nr:hypothetical protein FGG08_000656 [Glutinoglossum americanum]